MFVVRYLRGFHHSNVPRAGAFTAPVNTAELLHHTLKWLLHFHSCLYFKRTGLFHSLLSEAHSFCVKAAHRTPPHLVINEFGDIRKLFRPLDFYHSLLRYRLILKCNKIKNNPLINRHTIPHNDKPKTGLNI